MDKQQGATALMHAGPERSLLVELKDIDIRMSYCFRLGQATDADMPNTLNSQIVYAILPSTYSDNFTIDPNSGVLTNSGNLDREVLDSKLQGRVELIVTATDKGTPPLSSNVTVIVNIEVSVLQIVFRAGFC